jgi:hypothetical protein
MKSAIPAAALVLFAIACSSGAGSPLMPPGGDGADGTAEDSVTDHLPVMPDDAGGAPADAAADNQGVIPDGAADGDNHLDAGPCPPDQILRYFTAGCGASAVPTCGSPIDDACFIAFCGCDGTTIGGCGFTRAPFAHAGPCADASADGG